MRFENSIECVRTLCSLFLMLPEVNSRESITLGLKLAPSARDLEHRTNLIRLSDARCTQMTCITVHVLNHEVAPSITELKFTSTCFYLGYDDLGLSKNSACPDDQLHNILSCVIPPRL